MANNYPQTSTRSAQRASGGVFVRSRMTGLYSQLPVVALYSLLASPHTGRS